ncbi:hypothetical protein Gpo141_00010588 [Globisporangium polare]
MVMKDRSIHLCRRYSLEAYQIASDSSKQMGLSTGDPEPVKTTDADKASKRLTIPICDASRFFEHSVDYPACFRCCTRTAVSLALGVV